uniref:Uncharacterized protein n=1 Tax=Setaria viridis TaxID=4556 RepID=A0A4U6TRT4_SETVI|nr:hypothetical protein SEVIR_7G064200v2 [Setaria viridis]
MLYFLEDWRSMPAVYFYWMQSILMELMLLCTLRLKFSRYFGTHDMDHRKLGSNQMVLDMLITDLVLGQALAPYLTYLIFFVVKVTKS